MFFSIVVFIFTIVILVVIHELGHFLVAKKFGIKVEEFGFGIPPKIWGKKIGETLVSINWIPFGGFVKLLGEDEVEKKVLSNPRSFAAKPVWQRIFVVIAGVAMNLMLAWVIFYTVIISQGFKIIYPTTEPGVYVGYLEPNFPAQIGGVKLGEKILSIDGKEVKNLDEPKTLIQQKKGEEIALTLEDLKGSKREINLTPQKKDDQYLIGVGFSPITFKQYATFSEKLFSGITYSWDLTKLTFIGLSSTISDLITGNIEKASQSVAGPVGIARVTNNILSVGWQAVLPYLWFVGVISLTLSIFNVLPIPALDGGRLFFLFIEAVFKRKVRAEVERIVHTVGFAVLLFLAFLVTYSDISKMVK